MFTAEIDDLFEFTNITSPMTTGPHWSAQPLAALGINTAAVKHIDYRIPPLRKWRDEQHNCLGNIKYLKHSKVRVVQYPAMRKY